MILRLIMMMAAVFMILLQPACAGASAFGDKVANLAEIKNIRVGITSERFRHLFHSNAVVCTSGYKV